MDGSLYYGLLYGLIICEELNKGTVYKYHLRTPRIYPVTRIKKLNSVPCSVTGNCDFDEKTI